MKKMPRAARYLILLKCYRFLVELDLAARGMRVRRLTKAAAAMLTLAYWCLHTYHQLGGDNSDVKKITLDDIFISVKTSKNYEFTRLPIILKTWFQMAKEQTWFFTDTDNPVHQNITNGHMVNTNCSDTHEQMDLCCKMSAEFDHYVQSDKKWFCHFDDDNYVNVPRLEAVLGRYNPTKDWYLGRLSIKMYKKTSNKFNFLFWFATGGAGFCISHSLAQRMIPFVSNGEFEKICKVTGYNDDIAMGYVVALSNAKITILNEFHSHLEKLRFLRPETFRDQISFSYFNTNVVPVSGFHTVYDPTRFISLHCFLFPHYDFCSEYKKYVFNECRK